MGRRRAPDAGSLGRALIRQQVQRSRSHRHTDAWVRRTLPSFLVFLSSYESVNPAKLGVRGHSVIFQRKRQSTVLKDEYCRPPVTSGKRPPLPQRLPKCANTQVR